MDPNTALREALKLLIDVAQDKGDTEAKTFLAAEQFETPEEMDRDEPVPIETGEPIEEPEREPGSDDELFDEEDLG